MTPHPAAKIFPLLTGADLDDLVEDIRAHGLLHPIVSYKGQILDGRNRLAACKLAGVAPRYEEWDGDSPTDFVLSANLHRRHLNAGQRAMIATDVRPLYEEEARARVGGRPRTDEKPSPKVERVETAGRAAGQLGVSKAYVYEADRLNARSPELAQKVRDGDVSLRAATDLAADGRTEHPVVAPLTSRKAEINAEAAARRVYTALAGIEGYAKGLAEVRIDRVLAVATSDDLATWESLAAEAISELHRLRRALRRAA